jgi:hypothetical protein
VAEKGIRITAGFVCNERPKAGTCPPVKIAELYSHLNGLEFLELRKPALLKEIKAVITAVDANKCKTKVSKEKNMKGKLLFSPIERFH